MDHHHGGEEPSTTAGGGGGGGTNVWVRHALLLSALSQSNTANNNNTSSSSSTSKSRLPPTILSGLPSGNNKTSRDEDQASDFTSVTANSSMASSAGVPSTNGGRSWGWVKARARPVSGGSSTAADADRSDGQDEGGGGVVVTIIDADHPDLDGRAVHIPSRLLNDGGGDTKSNRKKNKSSARGGSGGKSGGGGTTGTAAAIYGPDLVMANAWASFATSSSPFSSSSTGSRGRAGSGGQQQQLSGAAMEVPPADLIQLTHLHEPAVVYCLRYRYTLDEIYTATGPILLALNPFKDCSKSGGMGRGSKGGLYGEEMMRVYWERGEGMSSGGSGSGGNSKGGGGKSGASKGGKKAKAQDANPGSSGVDSDLPPLPPHVYAVADAAYRAMIRALDDRRGGLGGAVTSAAPASSATPPIMDESPNQSILVSGESGAGKTVTAKFLMQYLAALSQRRVGNMKARVEEEKENAVYARSSSVGVGALSSAPAAPSVSSNRGGANGNGSSGHRPRMSHFGTAVDTATANAYQSAHPCTSPVKSPIRSSLGHVMPTSPTGHGGGGGGNNGKRTTFSSSIEQQVLESNPILESFGNARTIRNDNSSRFGKFIEINFCDAGTLIGATIETYLLEKVRLITHADGERNYHIFYEVLAGASSSDQKKLMIDYASPEDFVMTRSPSGTYHRRDGVHDEHTYRELKTAMNVMGFDSEEQLDIFEIVSSLLHLSNLTFVEREHDECLLNEDNYSLEAALELCGVTLEALEAALCSVVIEAGGERLIKTLGMAQCTKALEALIKATYGALFEYLVRRVNGCIASGVEQVDVSGTDMQSPDSISAASAAETAAFIAVLDIFGFESFETNSFEQLCINYTNESLQQQFNRFVFKLEQAEYEREGISWKFIEFPDNQNILDLIDKRHTGILSVLDEQCIQAFNNDQSFANSLYDKHCGKGGAVGTAAFAANNGQKARSMFNIHHYAGPVEYNALDFLEKNKDETPKEINELLAGSENHFLQHLGEIILSRPMANANSRTPAKFGAAHHHHKQSSLIRVSVGKQFSTQLKQLRTRIDATSPHYIRCLKPNNELRPDHFDCAVIADQLRYAGILEAIRVSRVGYPQRYLHERFLSRYRILGTKELRSKQSSRGQSPAEDCKVLVDVIARKIWARKHGVLFGDDNPFSLPHTRGKRKIGRSSSSSSVPRTPAKNMHRTPPKIRTPAPSSPSAHSKDTGRFKANATPPPWANHKLKATPMAKCTTSNESSQSSIISAAESSAPKPPSSASKFKPPAPVAPKIRSKSITAVPAPPPVTLTVPDKVDLLEMGIQLGKTKVFLRQHAFDAMEAMRNRLKNIAATMINSAARMYLCRIAYLPVRDAYRDEQDEEQSFWTETPSSTFDEEYYSQHARNQTPLALVEKFEKHVRIQPKKKKKKFRAFKWLIVDGHWRRNVNFEEDLATMKAAEAAASP